MSDLNRSASESELVEALRQYLPSHLERRWLLGHQIREAELCAQHLGTLLRTISTYLPHAVTRPLLARLERAEGIQPTGTVEGGFTYGTVMFADISGFTAMSEKLSRLGKEGAEEIAGIVNRFFAALLEVTDPHGGDLLKFGGDALLVFFGGDDHARHACRAALQMQATMSRFSETQTSQGVFQLRMTVGLGSGALFMAYLGSNEGMEFAVMGQAMARMAQAEDQASAGEIFIDAETYRAVADHIHTDETRDGFHRLIGVTGDNSIDPALPAGSIEAPSPAANEDSLHRIAETLRRIQALELFLAPGLMDKIKQDPERAAIGGEYRPVTVLFANFYGIDEIIGTLGQARSAEITAILNAHFTTMASIIAKYGGVVNKVDSYAVGHRIMALFGAPRAHIDDPERAGRAALDMQEAMAAFAQLNTTGGTFSLKQRIGINTGLVFAGNVGSLIRQEYSVMGDEVNLTARLMAVAGEGEVLISHSTARQSGEAFLLHEREPVRVKGKALPVHNYLVLGLQERRARERRPLIGRDAEWQAIRSRADRALSGAAQIVTLVAEVGLGKSRLLDEVTAYWSERDAVAFGATCPSFGRHTPYLPWLDLLRALFGFNPADSSSVRLDKIRVLLQDIDSTWTDWTPLIGRLMGLDTPETDLIRALDAQSRQRAIFRVVAGLVRHVAGEHPLLLVIDDLQWADDTSIELTNHVAQQVTDRPLLIALAYRPEEPLPLKVADLPHHTTFPLQELPDAASLRLLETLLPTTPQMPDHLKRLILNKAHGNPLFIEEVAHALIENYLTLDEATGAYHARTDLEQIEVPDTVNRVIMSRIDRLGESSRNMLRVASVIGQQFEQWLLSAVNPYRQTEDELNQQLNELSQREILEGPHPDLLYLFRHVLTREVAYESLLYADRRQLHRRIGASIEAQHANRLAEYWEVLAYHFGLAEEWDRALTYHLQAGLKAQSVYANESAVHHFREALKAAARLPGSEDRQLIAHERLAEVLTTQGNYDEALDHNYAALALVLAVSASPEDMARRLADLCGKTAAIHEKKSNYGTAYNWLRGGQIALEGLEAIEAARIYLVGAGIYHRQGNNVDALQWCQRSLDMAGRLTTDEAVLKVLAHTYYLQGAIYLRFGENAKAVEVCRKSLAIYEQIGDIAGASQAHINLATAHFNRSEWQAATHHYQQALEIKDRIGDVYGRALVANNLAGVYLNQGELDQAERLYRESLRTWENLGSIYGTGFLHNNLATVFLHRKEWDQAKSYLDRSLELFQKIGAEDLLPEVYRHQAEACLGQGYLEVAQDWAQRSLDMAVAQGMKLEEGATRRVLAQAHAARGDRASAEHQLQESLDILEALDTPYEIGQTLFQIARLSRALGQASLTRAIALFQELGAQLDLAEAQALQSTLANASEPSQG